MDGVLGKKAAQGAGGKSVGESVDVGQVDRAHHILGQAAGILAACGFFLHQKVQPGTENDD